MLHQQLWGSIVHFLLPYSRKVSSWKDLALHPKNSQRVYFTEDNVIKRINNFLKTTLLAFFEVCKVMSSQGLFHIAQFRLLCMDRQQVLQEESRKACQVIQVKKAYFKWSKIRFLVDYILHYPSQHCWVLLPTPLLHEVYDPMSFAQKIIAVVVHLTFQAVCRAFSLLEYDAHWNHTLEKASICDSPNKNPGAVCNHAGFLQSWRPIQLRETHWKSFVIYVRWQMERERKDTQTDPWYCLQPMPHPSWRYCHFLVK